ncbi:hypothetical protein AAFC00_002479 [Neodothiora populina]|uniref:DUF427 domain-containing protein n=1 Tax=Neodothiora populina TaxID=2781224 RepID=A0ABR3P7I6_9PEZI
MAPPDPKDLKELAVRLAREGPVRTLPTPRRVRLLYKGACLADTLGTSGALFVWEHDYYPQLYLPSKAFFEPQGFETQFKLGDAIKDAKGRKIAIMWEILVRPAGSGSRDYDAIRNSIIHFVDDLEGPGEALRDMVKVNFDAVDQWLEEDTPIFVHPKDPFKRIDILTSTRPIKVSISGRIVAETSTSMHLYETGLPVRFYMPLTAIDVSVLRPSKTRTQCPYKGEAEYYNVVISGVEYKDVVWFYNRPTIECSAVAGMCCFYNEKVDIAIQEYGGWEKLERPTTHFG